MTTAQKLAELPPLPSEPTISVITPSFNQGQYIRETLQSVAAQGTTNIQHIVVDACSTDSTAEIVAEFPHVTWISEPDRGQADALNKGFHLATGDIIAWLNSDDRYEPNIFSTVVAALRSHPIVMGACKQIDEHGKETGCIINIERNRYDLMKYWIYNSVPWQPAIFFRRELLDAARISSTLFVDEDFEIAFDHELWVRMAALVPFSLRIPEPLAAFRSYGTNKTAADPQAMYRESSRVFRRYESSHSLTEATVSIVIPFAQSDPLLIATLASLVEQEFKDVECILVDTAGSNVNLHERKKEVAQLAAQMPIARIRYICPKAQGQSWAAIAYEKSLGKYLVMCPPGSVFGSSAVADLLTLFQEDSLGLVFPARHVEPLAASLLLPSGSIIDLDKLLSHPSLPWFFAMRRLTLRELAETAPMNSTWDSPKALSVRAAFKGWGVTIDRLIDIAPGSFLYTHNELPEDSALTTADLIVSLAQESEQEPFAEVRRAGGFSFSIPEEVVRHAKQIRDQ